MASPFPGMDPYLETYWGDVHATLIVYAREQLQRLLPSDLRARVEERVFVESDDRELRSIYPDVRIYERPNGRGRPQPATGGTALAEPLLVQRKSEPVTETFIEIREAGSGGRVITVIELVSMSNKQPGDGRTLDLKKQAELVAGGVNSVEIDLLRAGQPVTAARPEQLPRPYRGPYRICVWRATRPDYWEVYRVPLEERLPAIAIPLRPTDADVPLDLQPLIDRCYETGAYDDLDYTRTPDPPLDADDEAWADRLLREKGRRK
jgi:hypothetical protein